MFSEKKIGTVEAKINSFSSLMHIKIFFQKIYSFSFTTIFFLILTLFFIDTETNHRYVKQYYAYKKIYS